MNANDDLTLTQLRIALGKLTGRRGEPVYDEAVKVVRRWMLAEAKAEIAHVNALAAQLEDRGEKASGNATVENKRLAEPCLRFWICYNRPRWKPKSFRRTETRCVRSVRTGCLADGRGRGFVRSCAGTIGGGPNRGRCGQTGESAMSKKTKPTIRKSRKVRKTPTPPPPSWPAATLLSGVGPHGEYWCAYEPEYYLWIGACHWHDERRTWVSSFAARGLAVAEIRRLVAFKKAALAARQTCNTSTTNTTPFTIQVAAPDGSCKPKKRKAKP